MRPLLLAVLLLAFSFAEDEIFPVEKRGNRKHYCGNELRLTLMFLCDSIYKRGSSDDISTHEDWMMQMNSVGPPEESQPQASFPFRSKAEAWAMMPRFFRRHTRGVADECCSKPCSINELKTYCGLPQ